MQSLVDLSILGERKATSSKTKPRRSSPFSRQDLVQASLSSPESRRAEPIDIIGVCDQKEGLITDENWPLRENVPASPERPLPPLPPSRPSPHPYDEPLSNYVNAPADKRDEIIEALVSELEDEQYLGTKTRWEVSEDHLEELDAVAPSILQEIFHDKISALSEKFFPRNVSWALLATRLTPAIKRLNKMKYFSEPIKLPCTPETWDAVRNHPQMTSALFVEGIISNTLAYHMCSCPIFQVEDELATQLGVFYRYCKGIDQLGPQSAEWMALTLQMIQQMLNPDETDPKKRLRNSPAGISTVEGSSQTRTVMWALTDTFRILREAVRMPFGTEEWRKLVDTTQDLVSEAFKLSVQWHSKPLAFKQYGMTWFWKKPLQICSDSLSFDEETIINWGETDPSQKQHVAAVISPVLLRGQWTKPGEDREQVKVWMKPRLLIAPGPPPLEIK
ncbi:hypothetical protein TWF718_005735 [Orbilia javanica]|uniref:Uncharacterized protein n=1 Tax=Orbilia javanica TaxID=47235 RepID=A0AAN8N1E1_9PEZI